MIAKILSLIERVQNKKVDAAGLALFRVCYSLTLIFELIQLFFFRKLVFYREAIIIPYELNFSLVLLIWIVIVGFILVGFFTKYAVIINYIFSIVIFGTTTRFEYHMDYAYTGISFLLLFLPISNKMSIDSLITKYHLLNSGSKYEEQKVSVWNYYIPILVAIGFIYFDSIFHKITSYNWTNGLGMWLPASLPQATYLNLKVLLNQKYIVLFLGYLTFLFELVFIFLFWYKRYRILLWLIGFGLHFGILLAFPIPLFGLGYISIYILLMPIFWSKYILSKINTLFSVFERKILSLKLPETLIVNFYNLIKPVEISSNLKVRALFIFFVMVIVCQISTTYHSPSISKVRKEYKFDEYFIGNNILKVSDMVHAFSRHIFGITPHGVFMDSHFKDYNHIIGIVYQKDDNLIWLPIINENGQCENYISGRFWVNWTFRVCSPNINLENTKIGLKGYTAFWLTQNGIGLEDFKFSIMVKKVEIPTKWEENFLQNQMQKPWQDVGTILWKNGECEITILDIESL
jgi:hypothetical protein